MTRWQLGLVIVVVATAATVGAATSAPVGALVGLLIGVILAAVLWLLQARRLRSVAREVNRWVAAPHEPLELDGGQPWEQLAVALNALGASHERRHHRLARAEPWRRRLVSTIEGPALLFSAEDRLVVANEAARGVLGVVAEPGSPLIQALGSAAFAAAAREAREVHRPIQVDADVADRELRATASAIGDEVLVMISDRTDQRRVEELRRNFVVNASHELKTPATAISALSGALEVAIRTGSERTPQLVARLGEESDRLVRMVHDLLDLRRLEEPGVLEAGPVDLAALVHQAAADLSAEARDRRVSVVLDVPDRAMVAGIAEDLRLVVENLLANAVQYTDEGGRVEVRLGRDDGAYVLGVSDSGIGIPQADLPRIFERFYRVDVARSRERGGTGLGLSIVRHALERHGGSVRVESLLGEGSTFTARIPVEPVD